jgi:hypothetical protein
MQGLITQVDYYLVECQTSGGMLEYWNIGMMETDGNLKVTFSASGIASFPEFGMSVLFCYHYSNLPSFQCSMGWQ